MIAIVIIDSPVPLLLGNEDPNSLLSLPLGPGTVLSHLAGLSSRAGSDRLMVLTSGQAGAPRGADALHGSLSDVRWIGEGGLPGVLQELEPSDRLLFVDPRHWPLEGFDFSEVLGSDSFIGATHLLAIGSDQEDVVERVEYDDDRRVSYVRRMYHHVTRPGTQNSPVLCSLVPVCAMPRHRWSTLNELRIALAANGVLSRDTGIHVRTVDLSSEQGLLAANEHVIAAAVDEQLPPDFSRLSPGVLIGRGALVSESAHITPPVIIQPGAIIEEDVKLVGPTLVGACSAVLRGAMIAQALVLPTAEVPAGIVARHCVVGSKVRALEQDNPDWSSVERAQVEGQAQWTHVPCSPTVSLEDGVDRRPLFGALKRTADITVAALGLLVLSPVLLIVAILIKLDSRGPVLFVHHREGRRCIPFPCYKFRTMCADAHRRQRELYKHSMVDGPQFKMKDDPRITRVGHLVRMTNIDEIPQLFNVLLGHMSLVGPRPSPFRENQICVPWRRARLSVRPGITGLWQICRDRRSSGDFQQWIFYDTLYVRHASAWLDIKIILATVFTLGGFRSLPPSYFVPIEGPHVDSPQRTVPVQAAGS